MNRWVQILGGLAAFGVLAFVVGVGGGMLFENIDSFCASCHTEPETTYYQHTQAPDPTTLASLHYYKLTRCIDCHSGQGFVSRIITVFRFGVKDTLAYYSGNYHKPAITTRPLGNDSCTKCHDLSLLGAGGGAEEGGSNHFHTQQLQDAWLAAGGPLNRCTVCHPAHQQVGGPTTIFTSQSITDQGCTSCHSALGVGG